MYHHILVYKISFLFKYTSFKKALAGIVPELWVSTVLYLLSYNPVHKVYGVFHSLVSAQ